MSYYTEMQEAWNRWNNEKEDRVKKQSWYHGHESRLGMFTYTCSHCGSHVKQEDIKCPGCGKEFL